MRKLKHYLILRNPKRVFSTEDALSQERFEYWKNYLCSEFVKMDCDSNRRDNFYAHLLSTDLDDLSISELYAEEDVKFIRKSRHIDLIADNPYALIFQLKGNGLFKHSRAETLMNQGDLYFVDSTDVGFGHCPKSLNHLIIQIPRHMIDNRVIDAEGFSGTNISQSSELGGITKDFCLSIASRLNAISDDIKATLANQLTEMVANCLNDIQGHNQKISAGACKAAVLDRMKNYIQLNATNPELTVSSIAKHHKVSVRHMYKLFEQEALSAREAIVEERLQTSRALLERDTSTHITDIAMQSGFACASHFTKKFKQRFGTSPTDYRRRFRE